jgi:hypothetical protein
MTDRRDTVCIWLQIPSTERSSTAVLYSGVPRWNIGLFIPTEISPRFYQLLCVNVGYHLNLSHGHFMPRVFEFVIQYIYYH